MDDKGTVHTLEIPVLEIRKHLKCKLSMKVKFMPICEPVVCRVMQVYVQWSIGYSRDIILLFFNL